MDRHVWAEIDLRKLTENFKNIQHVIAPKTKIMAVVKANAYGHGDRQIAKHLESLCVDYLGVSCMYEAKRLRHSGITVPILILGYANEDNVKDAVSHNITLNVMDEKTLEALDNEARQQKKVAKMHVKIDTGMHRLGLLPEESIEFIKKISSYQNIILEGVFTHFAESDADDLTFTRKQLHVFQQLLRSIKALGIDPPLIHAANSAAILKLPQSHFTMVRPGKILYGPLPTPVEKAPFTPQQIISLKTKIIQIREIGIGESVGYNRTYVATKPTRVAALPIGFADGFRRAPSTFGTVLVKGTHASLIGRVSMDQSSIDITHIKDCEIGDEVVLIGIQKNHTITTQDIATKLGTINYEVLTALSERVTRLYNT